MEKWRAQRENVKPTPREDLHAHRIKLCPGLSLLHIRAPRRRSWLGHRPAWWVSAQRWGGWRASGSAEGPSGGCDCPVKTGSSSGEGGDEKVSVGGADT